MPSPLPCSPMIRECSWKKIQTEKKCWKYWIMMDYGKQKLSDENQRFDWIKSIHWYRLVDIGWIADINLLDSFNHKNKNTVGGYGNKGSSFADFVGFHPHTKARTHQSLPHLSAVIRVCSEGASNWEHILF